jgi:hypothetical protein
MANIDGDSRENARAPTHARTHALSTACLRRNEPGSRTGDATPIGDAMTARRCRLRETPTVERATRRHRASDASTRSQPSDNRCNGVHQTHCTDNASAVADAVGGAGSASGCDRLRKQARRRGRYVCTPAACSW